MNVITSLSVPMYRTGVAVNAAITGIAVPLILCVAAPLTLCILGIMQQTLTLVSSLMHFCTIMSVGFPAVLLQRCSGRRCSNMFQLAQCHKHCSFRY